MTEIERKYAEGRVDRLDGLSISFDDFWFNVRPSNTEPLLRLRLEARSPAVAQEKSEEIKRILAANPRGSVAPNPPSTSVG
jgi:phosphomannomutase